MTQDTSHPPRPPLEVGQVWRTREGRAVTVDKCDPNDADYPFQVGGFWYRANGEWCSSEGDDPLDLIELISPAPAKPRRFVAITRTNWIGEESEGCTFDAVADDGTAWWRDSYQVSWTQHPPLPDRPAS